MEYMDMDMDMDMEATISTYAAYYDSETKSEEDKDAKKI